MKIKRRLIQLAIVALGVAGGGHTAFTTNKPELLSEVLFRFVIKTQVQDRTELSRLSHWLQHQGYDVAGMNISRGEVEVITNQQGLTSLKGRGLDGQVVGSSLDQVNADPRYLNPDTVEAKLREINQKYPESTHLEEIGRSLQGRPILALLVSSTPDPNDPAHLGRPSIIVDGLHHAREVMTPEIVVDYAETILGQAKTNPTYAQILKTWDVWLVPMLNVDGSNIVFTQNAMWRKNAHGDQGNIYGVDINRNYKFQWASCNGSSTEQSAQDYHGPSAGSEPETQALMNLAERVRPTTSLSYHSYSELVLYPYGCSNEYVGEKELTEKIANELAAQLPRDSGSGNYDPGPPWQLLYDVDGDSMSHLHATYGTLAYTFEVNEEFQPPYEQRDPTVQKHRKAWTYFFDRVSKNLLTVTVVDGRTNSPVQADITIDTIPQAHSESPLRSNAGGNFFEVLDPGHYVVTAKAAGRTGQITVDMSGTPQHLQLVVP